MVFTTTIVKSRPHVDLPTSIMADIVLKTNLPLRYMGSHQSSSSCHSDQFTKEREELEEKTRRLDRTQNGEEAEEKVEGDKGVRGAEKDLW